MKIITFEWDNAKGEEHNGKHLMIGQHLPNRENDSVTHCEIYGIYLNTIDEDKEMVLKRLSCYQPNIINKIESITKERARELLIAEIDKSLDVLFDEEKQIFVNQKLNIDPNLDHSQRIRY